MSKNSETENVDEMEEIILGQIEAALPPKLIDKEQVRQMLRVAVMEGLDPKAMYERAAADRPTDWATPPTYEEVAPTQK